jgi:integrase
MAGKKVVLCWNAKTPRGWRRFPARFEARGNRQVLLHGSVVDGGEVVQYDTGRYELRSYGDGKMVYTQLPEGDQSSPEAAIVAWHVASRKARGNTRKTDPFHFIKASVDLYVRDLQQQRKNEMAEKARHVLEEFRLSCSVDDKRLKGTGHTKAVTRAHILRFHSFLRERGNGPRTIADKHQRVKAWLRFSRVDTSWFPPLPKFETTLPTIYDKAQIDDIRAVADDYMRLAIDLCWMLGLREQEATHAEWADVDWSHSVFRVQGKIRLHYRFSVKDSEQREVPVPAALLARLRTRHEAHPDTRLIIGNKRDRPEGHLLRKLKALARNAGLNCTRCEGCQRKGAFAECEVWSLHRFRRTFCTMLLRNGVDLPTAQRLMGHNDLASTMRYLRPAATEHIQSKVTRIFGD